MNVKELHERNRDRMLRRSLLEEEIEELEDRAEQLKIEADDLADADDTDGYKEKMRAARDLEDDAYVKKKQLKKTYIPESYDDILEAWANYCPAEEERCKKILDEYLEARKAAAKLIYEYYDIMRSLYIERKELASYANVSGGDVSRMPIDMSMFYEDDLKLYWRCGEYSAEQEAGLRTPHNIILCT